MLDIPNGFYTDFFKENNEAIYIGTNLGFSFPLHMACPSKSYAMKSRNFIYYAFPKSLPAGSFRNFDLYGHEINIVSPELCFLQAAREMDFIDLALFGYELCSIYTEDPSSQFKQRKCDPITNVKTIRTYIKNAKGLKGQKAALDALKYVLDNSNSPMESKIAFISTLPEELGGYNLGNAQMNYPIPLEGIAQTLVKTSTNYIRGDIVWPERKMVLEYNSDLAHSEKNNFTKDANRQTAFQAAGYQSFVLTSGHFSSVQELDKVMMMFYDPQSLESAKEKLSHFKDTRKKLFQKLFKVFMNNSDNSHIPKE